MNENDTLIYVGPSLDQIVRNGASFRGGSPPRLTELLYAYPFINELMVTPELLAEAKKNIRNSESNLNTLYRKAENIRRKK
jgi:hypothetical protein